MDEIAQKLLEVDWQYGDKDPNALEILSGRIAETGKNLALIPYSSLVEDVEFVLPNLQEGRPHRIKTYDWTGLDRRIIGDFLGYISKESYLRAGFFASALVVGKSEFKPSSHFFEWMEALEVIPNMSEDSVAKFWIEHVNKAHNWYSRHPVGS